MMILDLREPVSAWSHAAGVLLSLPATFSLWRLSRDGGRGKQLSLLIYGLSMTACYQASALFHGARVPASRLAILNLLDHIGIYLFIAGTYTSVVWNLLRGPWRRWTLVLTWGMAVAGSALQVASGNLSPWVSTGLYLGMGWGAALVYFELARVLSHRTLRPIVVGGLFYSVGALFFVLDRPVVWPGVLGGHELFHLFVLAGSLAHYGFVLKVIVPLDPATVAPVAEREACGTLSRAGRLILRLDPGADGGLHPYPQPSRGEVPVA